LQWDNIILTSLLLFINYNKKIRKRFIISSLSLSLSLFKYIQKIQIAIFNNN